MAGIRQEFGLARIYYRALIVMALGGASAGALTAGERGQQVAGDTVASEPRASTRQKPFYIVPHVEGLLQCDEALGRPEITQATQATRYCIDHGLDGSAALARLMEQLEPGGAHGAVQVGFTLTVPLLELFIQSKGGQWKIDEKRVDAIMRLIARSDRPVVLYLSSSHFDTLGPLSAVLAADPANLMKLASGKPPALGYFGFPINPYTLRIDAAIPVNRYRAQALRHIAQRVRALPAEVQDRIIAIPLLGEVHQLFPDFEHGTGNFDHIQVTDYDPASVREFRDWLKEKYGDLGRFNKENGFSFSSFNAVEAPSKDIRTQPLNGFAEHYDAYARGLVPVAGWVWDPKGRITRLELYVDGKLKGPIERGFNRLDVYRVRDDVLSPNVGYRYNLDFSSLPTGHHRLQVVAWVGAAPHVLGERILSIIPRNQHAIGSAVPEGIVAGRTSYGGWLRFIPQRLVNWLRRKGWLTAGAGGGGVSDQQGRLSDVESWLDLPKERLDVYYNPLARDWDEFRSWQVERFFADFYKKAREAGLPADKLYSHEVLPQVNSSWNGQLFAVPDVVWRGGPWKPGFNLYGGATSGTWISDFLKTNGLRDYGVPEFNPQQWKKSGVHLAALRMHFSSNARFISPFYFSLVAPKFKTTAENSVNRMEIAAAGASEGSAQFYQAIQEFARE